MLDLFTIFTKGGIVLWCFRETKELFAPPVNALIRSVILQVICICHMSAHLKHTHRARGHAYITQLHTRTVTAIVNTFLFGISFAS